MARLIDKLAVKLSLDSRDFVKSARRSSDAFTKSRKVFQKEAKETEQAAKSVSNGIEGITRKVIAMYAVFLGGKGLKSFTEGLISSNAAIGRFSKNLGLAPQYVQGLGNAVKRMGGNASATAQTIKGLGKMLFDFQTQGKGLPLQLSQLEAMTKVNIPLNRGIPAFINGTAEALKKLYAAQPAKAQYLAEYLGIDDDTFNLMVKFGREFNAQADKNATITQKAIKESQQLQDAFAQIGQEAERVATKILEDFGPAIQDFLKNIADWIHDHRDDIISVIQTLADDLGKIPWTKVGDEAKHFGDYVADAAGDVKTLTHAVEILMGLWAGGKLFAMLSGIGKMRAALAGLGIGTEAVAAGGGAAALGVGSGGLWGIVAALLGIAGYEIATPGSALNQMSASPEGAPSPYGGTIQNRFAKTGSVEHYTPKAGKVLASKEQKKRAQESYDFWRSKGATKEGALAMVGNEQGESHFDWSVRGDSGSAGGAFQWHQDRRDKILAATGIDVWDADTTHQQQLEAAYAEMTKGLDGGAGNAWKVMTTPGASLTRNEVGLVYGFERPADKAGQTRLRSDYGAYWGAHLNTASNLASPSNITGDTTTNNNSTSTSSTSIGNVTIQTQSTDSAGVFKEFKQWVDGNNLAASAEGGLS